MSRRRRPLPLAPARNPDVAPVVSQTRSDRPPLPSDTRYTPTWESRAYWLAPFRDTWKGYEPSGHILHGSDLRWTGPSARRPARRMPVTAAASGLLGGVAGRSGRLVRRAGPGPRLRRSAGRSLGPGAGGPRPGWRGRWPGRSGPGRSGRAPRSRGWRRRGPVGLENTIRVPGGQAGGEVVLVGESAEDLLAPDPALGEVDRFRRMGVSLGWGQQAQGTVRPGSVVRASCHDPAFHPARPHGAPDHTGRPIGP